MAQSNIEESVTIDGKLYKPDELSESAQAQLANIRFVDGRIVQLNNELAVSDTARIAYLSALKSDLSREDKK